MFAITVGYGIALPILPFLIEQLDTAADAALHTGLLTGAYILAIFVFAPLWGKLSDKWGRRSVILLGLTGFAATVALFALTESLPFRYIGRFLDGLFAAAVAPVVYALVGDYARSDAWRAHRFALVSSAGTAGFFIGPLLGALVLQGLRDPFAGISGNAFALPFIATSGLAVLAALMVWFFVPGAAQRRELQPKKVEQRRRQPVLLRLLAIAFVTTLAIGAFEVGLSLRGKQVLGMDAVRIGMMFAECALVMFVVQALVFSPLVKPEVTRWFVTPGLVILAIGLLAVPFSTTFVTTTIALVLVAASAGIVSPVVTSWVSLYAGEMRGAELGRVIAVSSLGQALGSAAGGFLSGFSILPGAAFTVAAIAVLAGVTVSLGLPRLLLRYAG